MKLQTMTVINREDIVVEWKQQLGYSGSDVCNGIGVDYQGNVYITGYTTDPLDNSSAGGVYAWVAKYDSQGQLHWKQQLGSSEYDLSNDIAVDHNGNVYITGETSGQGSLAEGVYAWVAKYDSQGQLHWKQQLGFSEYHLSKGIAVDRHQNVYITGYTTGQLGNNSVGCVDVWIAKYDPQGQLYWKQQLGSSEYHLSKGIAVDHQENIYIIGETTEQLGNSSVEGVFAWVAKYDSQGQLCWKQQLSSLEYLLSKGIALDNQGNVYITGYTTSDLDSNSVGGVYAWIAKYDPQGKLCWKRWRQQLGSSEYHLSKGIAVDNQGNVYITGGSLVQLGSSRTGGVYAWVAKYEPQGQLCWKQQLGSLEYDLSNGIAVDNGGNVYIMGYTTAQSENASGGDFDAWVAKLAVKTIGGF